jgi:transcriptional regulator with XRE-family HTH domain
MIDQDAEARQRIAARIREARQMAGLSQAQVAHVLGLSRPSISEIESGGRRVGALELSRLANAFDVSVPWLLGESEGGGAVDDPRLRLAARELSKLKPEELDRLLSLLSRMRRVHTDDLQASLPESPTPERGGSEGVD